MKYFSPFILILFFSCNNRAKEKQPAPTTVVQDSAQVLQAADGTQINLINDYQVTDTANDYILFPLQVNDAKDKTESFSLYSKERGEGSLYWNIIFHNYKTGENNLLEPQKKILIGGYEYRSSYSRDAYAAGKVETFHQTSYIMYTVYSEDYNGDKKLGTNDPAYVFISNPDGTGFKQISPYGISIMQKDFPKNKQLLLLKGIADSNKDKKFNEEDEQVFYQIDMADSSFKAIEVFNQAFKIKLKNLFDKNWKK